MQIIGMYIISTYLKNIRVHILLFLFSVYSGNLGVVLFNHSNEDLEVAPGDRIAQLICERIIYPKLEEVESLNDTNRGTGGFGSTGK